MAFIRRIKVKGHYYDIRVRSQREGKKVTQIYIEYIGRSENQNPNRLSNKEVSTPKQTVDLTGEADRQGVRPEDVNQSELKKGIEIEHEHTKDKAVAKQIATDHLTENKQYYTDLDKMEKSARKRDKQASTK
jgi:hypothetical protein